MLLYIYIFWCCDTLAESELSLLSSSPLAFHILVLGFSSSLKDNMAVQ